MKVETQSSTIPADDLLGDLRLLVEESEKIASQAQDRSPEETLAALRARVEVAEERLESYAGTAGFSRALGPEYRKEVIFSHPKQLLAIAFGIGTVAGFLLGRRWTGARALD